MNDENQHNDIFRLHELNREPLPSEHPLQAEPVAPPSTPVQPPVATGTFGSASEAQALRAEYVTPGEQMRKRSSRWRYVFMVLGILQALGIALFFGVMVWAMQQARAGVSGTEFIALWLFITLVPAVGLIAFVNMIGLPIYMAKQKPKGKGLGFSIVSLVISVLLVAYGAYTAFQMYVIFPSAMGDRAAESQARARSYAEERAKASNEITAAEAIELLQGCQLRGFYYTNQDSKSNGSWGELSTSGVVLTEVDNKPYRISIADRLIPELVPVAREAQKTCPNLQFWHDGNYE